MKALTAVLLTAVLFRVMCGVGLGDIIHLTSGGRIDVMIIHNNPNGDIKVKFSIDSDWFSTFDFGADKVRFYVKTGNKKGAGSGGGESGSGGSDDLGKKVADTWKKLLQ